MTHTKFGKSFYTLLLIVLLLIAAAIRGGADFDWLQPVDELVYNLEDVKVVYSKASTYSMSSDRSLEVYDNGKNLLGYALISEELDARFPGYGGKVPLLIGLDTQKVVIGTYLLRHNETAEFIDHINDTKLLNTWDGLVMDTLLLMHDVDVISGATKSSTAIIRTFHSSVGNYLETNHKHGAPSFERITQLVLLLVLLLLSLSMQLGKRFRQYYIYYLLAVVVIMGVWLTKMLSLELFHNWLTKGLPWQSNWELISILVISITLAIAGHKKYYCNYLCPMGALQMLASKVSPFKKRSINLKISVLTLRTIYLSFIWTSLILGFLLPLAQLEPFMAFSFKVASWLMLIAGAVIVMLSLFFNRPWCQLCPTGCLLDSIPSFKSKRN
ncbi:4Fe-4S binding protein [Carboxylicivirga sp. M1479]|uniref:4Fe-4S binding protein n=1 Tax=Carboxylicivirga sp. M1479 TaxID=2594476 RepID=UPI00117855F4|nr:4Fe-4S binding protein [Carboxylicivirga sp. M1479]TRX66260.1 4Fe-4S binding protein [Carboxylicivirga sp. M1479]